MTTFNLGKKLEAIPSQKPFCMEDQIGYENSLEAMPWEPTFHSFLGVISPIFLGIKTLHFLWLLGSNGGIFETTSRAQRQ